VVLLAPASRIGPSSLPCLGSISVMSGLAVTRLSGGSVTSDEDTGFPGIELLVGDLAVLAGAYSACNCARRPMLTSDADERAAPEERPPRPVQLDGCRPTIVPGVQRIVQLEPTVLSSRASSGGPA